MRKKKKKRDLILQKLFDNSIYSTDNTADNYMNGSRTEILHNFKYIRLVN